MPITKRDVEGLLPQSIVWDQGRGSVAGFGVRRQKSRPVFILKSRVNGRQRWFSIGTFGAPWTVETARTQAKVILGDIAVGVDPSARGSIDENDMTISDLCDRYLEAASAGQVMTRFGRPKRSSTLAIDVGRIERHIKPLIGVRRVREVVQSDIARLIDDVTIGKTASNVKTGSRGRAIVKGGPGSAARVANLLSGVFAWAVKRGYTDNNPVHGAERYKGTPRTRFLAPEELARLGRVLMSGRDSEGKGIQPQAIEILWLLALTGCRLNEIASLRWDELDLASHCLRLTQSKTGRNLRPIGSAAQRRLSRIERTANSPYIFPATRGPGHFQGTKREVDRVMRSAQIKNSTCHTLRHTFATNASELEYSDLTIAGLLGHSTRTITSRYAHRPDSSLVLAATKVSEHTESLMMSLIN